MNGALILQPMVGMMLLTAVVWFYMYARRIPAMRNTRVPVQTYTTPEKATELLPATVNYSAYNLKNLFELPVLFYALCLTLYVTDSVDMAYLIAAWVFLFFRVLHSVVHCTVNIVILRFYLYAAGALVLWFMLLRATIDVFTA